MATQEQIDRAIDRENMDIVTWDELRDELYFAVQEGRADMIDFEDFLEAYASHDRYVGGYCGQRNGDTPADHYGTEGYDWPSWSKTARKEADNG